MSIPLIILGFLLFVGLVVIHEFGHFILARRNGVEVEEFGIGFPPRAKVLTKKNGTVYTLNWLPLGGFVKLKGEHDADTQKGSFGAASLWAKVKIMLAGVVMNTITAFALFTLLALVGMPKIIENQFTVESDTKVVQRDVLAGYVEPDSPASEAGIQEQDELASIGAVGQPKHTIESMEGFPETTKALAGQDVEVQFRRDGEFFTSTVQLRGEEEVAASQSTDEPKGYLGVAPSEYVVQRSTWSAPVVAVGLMKQITEATFKGLGTAISSLFQGDTEKASSQVSGVVGIGYIIGKGSALGLQFILLIIAIISLTLAIMNVLPLPALDGGRLFFTLLYRGLDKIARLFERRIILTRRAEEWIHGTGFMLLMVLFVLITIVDINRF